MRKILGIFLAVCFVLSVTAAAASAGYGDDEKILEVYASIFEKRTIPDAQTRTDRVPVTARSL